MGHMYVIDPENNVVTVTDPNHHHIYVNSFYTIIHLSEEISPKFSYGKCLSWELLGLISSFLFHIVSFRPCRILSQAL